MRRKISSFLVLTLLLFAAAAGGCGIVGYGCQSCIGFFASFESEEPETVTCPVCGERHKLDAMYCPVCQTPVKGSSRNAGK